MNVGRKKTDRTVIGDLFILNNTEMRGGTCAYRGGTTCAMRYKAEVTSLVH